MAFIKVFIVIWGGGLFEGGFFEGGEVEDLWYLKFLEFKTSVCFIYPVWESLRYDGTQQHFLESITLSIIRI